jgi:hypothetical protein
MDFPSVKPKIRETKIEIEKEKEKTSEREEHGWGSNKFSWFSL